MHNCKTDLRLLAYSLTHSLQTHVDDPPLSFSLSTTIIFSNESKSFLDELSSAVTAIQSKRLLHKVVPPYRVSEDVRIIGMNLSPTRASISLRIFATIPLLYPLLSALVSTTTYWVSGSKTGSRDKHCSSASSRPCLESIR